MHRHCAHSGPSGESTIGTGRPLAIIAGPCALESVDLALRIGEAMQRTCAELGLTYIFKASYDKANRTSASSKRGVGMAEGLEILARVRATLGVPITTDIHLPDQAAPVAEVADILQIPAFLCRQTDLLVAAAEAAKPRGRAVNVKKGQFLSPKEMAGPVGKLRAAGCDRLIVTERGTFFGYHALVNDFAGVGDLLDTGTPASPGPAVCFDATHSVQRPGLTDTTGGRRERIPLLARAAAAAGVDAIFLEVHPTPESAPSDAATMLPLAEAPALVRTLAALAAIARTG
jgi:2-dehydro-3-deoxyphosphooctonate aldolase (KDO 8-P synthase)